MPLSFWATTHTKELLKWWVEYEIDLNLNRVVLRAGYYINNFIATHKLWRLFWRCCLDARPRILTNKNKHVENIASVVSEKSIDETIVTTPRLLTITRLSITICGARSGLTRFQQWPCYLHGPVFESHLQSEEFFACNNVSPLKNWTPMLTFVCHVP